MADYNQILFNEARCLLFKDDEEHKKPIPNGARATFQMFVFPGGPRNHFDEVYPGIFIGDKEIASDKDKLKKAGVTHVLNCAQGTKFNQIDTSVGFFKTAGIDFHGIKANDISTYKIAPEFPKAADFIESALHTEGNKVYVHCHQGISRSATIVLAFLMLKRGMKLIEALTVVRSKRKVHPNDGFLKQLCILNRELYESSD